jgi:hypothetical protein
MELSSLLHISGIVAIVGSFLYILGDLFLLAPNLGPIRSAGELVVDTAAAPTLRRRIYLLNTLNQLSASRLAGGALLGVFATPLVLFGTWQLYEGLRPAGEWLALVTALLLGSSYVIGAYVHGSFYHLGDRTYAVDLSSGGQERSGTGGASPARITASCQRSLTVPTGSFAERRKSCKTTNVSRTSATCRTIA